MHLYRVHYTITKWREKQFQINDLFDQYRDNKPVEIDKVEFVALLQLILEAFQYIKVFILYVVVSSHMTLIQLIQTQNLKSFA